MEKRAPPNHLIHGRSSGLRKEVPSDHPTKKIGRVGGNFAEQLREYNGQHEHRVYTRVYRNRQGNAYEGRCPHCSRPVRLRIGPGGINSRMFRAQ